MWFRPTLSDACRPGPGVALTATAQLAVTLERQPCSISQPGRPATMSFVSEAAQLTAAVLLPSADLQSEAVQTLAAAPPSSSALPCNGLQAAVVADDCVLCLSARQLQALLAAISGLQAEAARGFAQPLPKPCISTIQAADSARLPWISAVCLQVPHIAALIISAPAAQQQQEQWQQSQLSVASPHVEVPELTVSLICSAAGAFRPVIAGRLFSLQLTCSASPAMAVSQAQLLAGAMPASAAAAWRSAGCDDSSAAAVAAQHVHSCLTQPPAASVSELLCSIQRPSASPEAPTGGSLLTVAVHTALLSACLSPCTLAHLAALGMALSAGGPALPPVPLIPPVRLTDGPDIKVSNQQDDEQCAHRTVHLGFAFSQA